MGALPGSDYRVAGFAEADGAERRRARLGGQRAMVALERTSSMACWASTQTGCAGQRAFSSRTGRG